MIQRNGWCLGLLALLVLLNGFAFADENKAAKPKEFPDFKDIVTKEFDKIEGYYNVYKKKNKPEAYLEIPAGAMGQDFLMATTVTGGTVYTGFQWSDDLLHWKRFDKKLALIRRQIQYRADAGTPIGVSVARTYTDTLVSSYRIVTMNGGNPVLSLGELTLGGIGTFFGGMFRPGDASMVEYSTLKSFPENIEIGLTFPDRYGDFITLHYSIRSLPASSYQPRMADDRIGYFLTAHKNFSKGKLTDGNFVRYINRWNLKKEDPKLEKSPVVEPIIFYIEKTVPVQYRKFVREGIEEWNKAFEACGYYDAIVVRQQTENNEFKDLDPADARYNFFRWITSGNAFAMGPSRVDPRTGEILDADIIFDDAFIKYNMVEFDRMIREESTAGMSPRYREYLKKNPQKHPLARFAKNLAPEVNPYNEKAVEKHNLMKELIETSHLKDKQCVCTLGQGRAHQMNVARMFFGGVMKDGGDGGKGGDKPKKPKTYPDDFIGQVLKDTVMHEVGHTLGLRHNFKASSYRSIKDIMKKDAPGDVSGSVMDYNPILIKGTDKDAVQGPYAMTTIGPYDYWAIKYGYHPDTKAETLKEIASECAKAGHQYGTDEDAGSPDPYLKRWDFGNDLPEYARHRMSLANKLMENLVSRSLEKGDGYQNLKTMFEIAMFEHASAALSVSRLLGGEEINRHHYGDPDAKDPLTLISAEKQREAMEMVCNELLSADAYKFDADILTKLAPENWMHWGISFWAFMFKEHSYDIYARVNMIQSAALSRLMNADLYTRILNGKIKSKAEDYLTVPEIMERVRKAIWAELDGKSKETPTNQNPMINGFRRDIQREHLTTLIDLAMEDQYGWNPPTVRTLAWYELKQLKKQVDEALKSANLDKDTYTKAHLMETSTRIQKALDAAYTLNGSSGGGGFFFF